MAAPLKGCVMPIWRMTLNGRYDSAAAFQEAGVLNVCGES